VSTKKLIAHGSNFHFYEDLMVVDKGYVHLDIDGPDVEFEASPEHISVGIPEEIMDAIAQAWIDKRMEDTEGETEQ
jgi:hypothetical protein